MNIVREHFRSDGGAKQTFARQDAERYAAVRDMVAYPCDFCGNWHVATRKGKEALMPAAATDRGPTPVTELGEDYPPYVVTGADQRRWDLCRAVAGDIMEGAPGETANIWQTTRALYHSDMPT